MAAAGIAIHEFDCLHPGQSIRKPAKAAIVKA
jgi:hypothetical protein